MRRERAEGTGSLYQRGAGPAGIREDAGGGMLQAGSRPGGGGL